MRQYIDSAIAGLGFVVPRGEWIGEETRYPEHKLTSPEPRHANPEEEGAEGIRGGEREGTARSERLCLLGTGLATGGCCCRGLSGAQAEVCCSSAWAWYGADLRAGDRALPPVEHQVLSIESGHVTRALTGRASATRRLRRPLLDRNKSGDVESEREREGNRKRASAGADVKRL